VNGRLNLFGRHHNTFCKRQFKNSATPLASLYFVYLLPVRGSVCTSKLKAFDDITTVHCPNEDILINELENLNWLTAGERVDELMLKFDRHFVMNSPLKPLFVDCLRLTPDSDRIVRKERNLIIPRCKTSFGQLSYSYLCLKDGTNSRRQCRI
jgi:hypothetical protein